ncbi:MAG: ribosome maturation factor RimM [Bacteroidetes bacterium]|nr:ribosome maturation factor RimM [Bacteroidota bacterium]
MIHKEDVFPIGKINKPHGINGEMSFSFTTDVFDSEDAPFFIFEIDGIFVPFFIESYRFKTDSTALLMLEDIDNEEKAREFNGLTIYLPVSFQDKVKEEEIGMSYFIGFILKDEILCEIGRVCAIDESTKNVLFIVENAAAEEILIPASDDFILDIDHEEKIISLRIPEGLLDI